jgi:hypothetical protein
VSSILPFVSGRNSFMALLLSCWLPLTYKALSTFLTLQLSFRLIDRYRIALLLSSQVTRLCQYFLTLQLSFGLIDPSKDASQIGWWFASSWNNLLWLINDSIIDYLIWDCSKTGKVTQVWGRADRRCSISFIRDLRDLTTVATWFGKTCLWKEEC